MRLPKGRGTKQRFASQVVHPAVLTVNRLNQYHDGDIVGPGQLRRTGLIGRHERIKLIGGGTLKRKVTVRVHASTASAQQAVEAAGGTVELLS
jgi:large subunit ribosomal protein L15